ncbi:putative PurR-regulated permease PerM [Marmoricola sp. OAE513]|uniref:AI-2E family transporter n=1 Tax=Marmoricola sp. OAE513 TaxID=2817894 RepID=UPI001AE728BF
MSEESRTERIRHRLAQQRAALRRREEEPVPVITTGTSNFSHAEVPWAYDLAAAWSWRFLVIVGALGVILYTLSFLAVIVFPVIIALLLAALAAPLVSLLERIGIRRKLAALIVVVTGIAAVALLLAFVGQQVASSVDQLGDKVVGGLDEVEQWLRTGPLHASDSQINEWIGKAQDFISEQGNDVVGRVTELGVAVGHVIAAFFIILFSTYFFLADGSLIWAWVVRLFPRAARARADSSGRVAWHSLTQFVRATVIVAATDAIGIMLIAWILGVPLVSAIGVLVFLGAFVPMIGAFLSGTVAVLVALVAHGPVVALLMLAGVVLVQQIEAHVLQPFLMGRWVSVHPLGVILAIGVGVVVAGIAGALIAVPLVAALNAVAQHLASYTDIGDDAEQSAVEDPDPDPELAAAAAADLAERDPEEPDDGRVGDEG